MIRLRVGVRFITKAVISPCRGLLKEVLNESDKRDFNYKWSIYFLGLLKRADYLAHLLARCATEDAE